MRKNTVSAHIRQFLSQHPDVKPSQIADKFNVSRGLVSQLRRELKAAAKLRLAAAEQAEAAEPAVAPPSNHVEVEFYRRVAVALLQTGDAAHARLALTAVSQLVMLYDDQH